MDCTTQEKEKQGTGERVKGVKNMDVVIITNGTPKEIAALVLAVQERQKVSTGRKMPEKEREQLIRRYESDIRQYEKRLERLKRGESPLHVIL